MMQVWYTSNEFPPFTQAQRDAFRLLRENQQLPIGNVIAGRHLLRCMCEDFQPIYDFLVNAGKEPVICGRRDEAGNWLEPKNQAEFDKHMQPVAGFDIQGNAVMVAPNDYTTSGWLAFNE